MGVVWVVVMVVFVMVMLAMVIMVVVVMMVVEMMFKVVGMMVKMVVVKLMLVPGAPQFDNVFILIQNTHRSLTNHKPKEFSLESSYF